MPERDTGPSSGPPIEVVSIGNVRATERHWIWPDRISLPSITILAGRGSVGKSTLLAAICAAVTKGKSLPGRKTKKLKSLGVMWCGAEESVHNTVLPRLKASGANLDRVYLPGCDREGNMIRQITFPEDLGAVRKIVRQNEIGLIIVDPIASYTPSIDLNQQQPVRQLMGGLRLISEECEVTWLLVAHPSKARTGPILDRVFGSASLVHCARSVLLLAEHPSGDKSRVLVHAKTNEGPLAPTLQLHLEPTAKSKGVPVIKWGEVCAVTMDMLGNEGCTAADADVTADARTLLRSILTDWRPANEVLAEGLKAGISERALRETKVELQCGSRRVADEFTAPHWEWGPPGSMKKGEK